LQYLRLRFNKGLSVTIRGVNINKLMRSLLNLGIGELTAAGVSTYLYLTLKIHLVGMGNAMAFGYLNQNESKNKK